MKTYKTPQEKDLWVKAGLFAILIFLSIALMLIFTPEANAQSYGSREKELKLYRKVQAEASYENRKRESEAFYLKALRENRKYAKQSVRESKKKGREADKIARIKQDIIAIRIKGNQ